MFSLDFYPISATSLDMDENDTFGGRFTRYAKVTSAMGGLAAKLAGDKFLGLKLDPENHAKDLKLALGGLKGPLMKVAQILATIPNALPEEYVAELSQLQSHAPAMGWPFVKRRMGSELGPDWRSRFTDFSQDAIAAASLGQVHQATTLDGNLVACKLQYPDMQSAVEADLRQLKLVLMLFESYDRAVATRQIHQELTDRLREELDYEREAKHMQLYGDMLKDEPGVRVPKVFPALSTKRLLTMEWLEGAPLLNFTGQDQEQRNHLAINMFRAWYVPFYGYGIIHGDPHLGNYSIQPNHVVNLLDFGCVRIFPPRFVAGVIDLYHALQTGDEALALSAYEVWGFKNLSKELLATLNIWAHFIYAPLLDDRVRLIGESDHGIYGRETAEKVHKELRRLGGVEVPREFVFMDRAALGLGSVFLHLKATVNWCRLFQDLIGAFDINQLEQRQQDVLARAHLTPLP